MLVGLLAAGVSSIIALVMGAVAALGGKKADAAGHLAHRPHAGHPHIVLLILILVARWGRVLAHHRRGCTHWPSSRASCPRDPAVQNSRRSSSGAAAGQTPLRIAAKHMVPVLPQFIGLILLFRIAILHEAAVTFLGFGLPPEQPAIGVILNESMAGVPVGTGMWWLAVFPVSRSSRSCCQFDLTGSSLRKLVDPHSARNRRPSWTKRTARTRLRNDGRNPLPEHLAARERAPVTRPLPSWSA